MKRRVFFFILCFISLSVSIQSVKAYTTPELPRVYIDTRYTTPSGARQVVKAGDDLQKAINEARIGDTIVLEAGATFTGNFVLPNKPGNGWIYVESSNSSNVPKPGSRVGLENFHDMPKIVSPNTAPAISTLGGAHNYRFVGVEVTTTWNKISATNYGIVSLEAPNQTSLTVQPHDIIFDRSYIHGTKDGNVRRGIGMNGKNIAVIDSYLSDFHEVGADSQAIASWNGSGPFKIVNNYIEGAGENILFGGSDPSIQNLIPSDIEVSGNLFTKKLSWKKGDPTYGGVPWTVKNIFELKNAARVLIENNTFENNWVMAQAGIAILFTVRNQDGTAPWSAVRDVTFRKNMVRNSEGGGINISGTDDQHVSQRAERILIEGNTFLNISGRLFQISNISAQGFGGVKDLTINHNTASIKGAAVIVGDSMESSAQHENFTFTNNTITGDVEYGFFGSGIGEGLPVLNAYFKPGWIFSGNMIGGTQSDYPTVDVSQAISPISSDVKEPVKVDTKLFLFITNKTPFSFFMHRISFGSYWFSK